MHKTLFFDIGNVLVLFDYDKMCAQVARLLQRDTAVVRRELEQLGPLYEAGAFSTQELYRQLLQDAPEAPPLELLAHALTDIFQPNTSMYPVVEDLKRRGHRLILLSNTSEVHIEFLTRNYPVLQLFDAAVFSHRVKARKPSQEIFQAALAAAGNVAPTDCFYVDDVQEYVVAARTLDIDAEVYVDTASFVHHLKKRALL